MIGARLEAKDLRAFLFGRRLYVFDPATRARFATVSYGTDNRCHAVFSDRTEDHGTYGFEGDLYWTGYSRFRDGAIHRFFLVRVEDDVMQAYHADGARAFLQSPLPDLRP